VSHDAQVPTLVRLPLTARAAVAVAGVGVVWVAVLLGARHLPVDLTVVLLLLLVLVLGLALLTGPVLGILTGLVSVVLVGWYLVPPYDTFEIASTENLVALVVFALLAGLASLLVELSTRIQAGAVQTRARAELIGEVVAKDVGVDAAVPLDRVRSALDLDRLSLLRVEGGVARVLTTTGSGPEIPSVPDRVVDAEVAGGYRLVGAGPPRIAEDPEFIESLAAAAVRSYESDRMDAARRRADELAAVDSARTALLASVGHDLRTPLAGLRLAVDALRAPGSHLDPESTAELLETVDDSTTRLDELITNLLDMSRLEAGVLLVHAEPTAVDAAVAGAVLSWPDAAVAIEVSDTLPLVLADPALLERVLENLVSNALRYAGPTSDAPVRITGWSTTSRVVLDVVDHGPGLGSGRPRLVTLNTGGTADRSTGLGLAIVRGFCEAMSIDLAYLETEGGGLTVRLSIPTAEGSQR
jgi:K+-sensing histidine kinase KdpD